MEGFIYEMPGLKEYEFNKDGVCRRKRNKHTMSLYTGYTGYERRWKCAPHYYLRLNDMTYERITLLEVQQWIKHCNVVYNFYGITINN